MSTLQQHETPADPPVRPDGKCARPGCGKKRRTQISSYARAQDFERDPFCSRVCCEQFHGLVKRELGRPGPPKG